jgi:hypothetical protein
VRRFHGFSLIVTLVALPAGATVTKDQCVDANGDGQALRLEGKLAAARQKLETCGDPSCPAIVREDCVRRLRELDAVQPTIAFDVVDAAGSPVASVRVTLDGRPLEDRLVHSALRVDPGEHTFVFAADGALPVTRRLVIKEGEKDRHERVALAPVLGSPPPSTVPVALEPIAAPRPGLGTHKLLGLTAGGAGIVGIALGSLFGVLTVSAANRQRSDCASVEACMSRASALSDHSSAQTDGAVSTVAFVAGGALLLGGAALFFMVPARPAGVTPERPVGAWRLEPVVGLFGAGLSLHGEL